MSHLPVRDQIRPRRRHRSDLESLLRLSARIGRNPLLVQASSGNTSVKLEGTMWIKASGKWLADAGREEILVPVDVRHCLDCLHEGRQLAANISDGGGSSLRPSIETFMHAALPQKVVIHVHSIDTIAWAVRGDGPAELAKRLTGLRWTWIPYVASGLPLAREVQAASALHRGTEIFVLGNHGLVVCAETCEGAEYVLSDVQRRLAIQPRTPAEPDRRRLKRLQDDSSWRVPDSDVLHTLGTDAVSRRILNGGILFPCQAIFLGLAFMSLKHGEWPEDVSSPFLIVEPSGILINGRITPAEYAVLNGFAEVLLRIEASAPLRYLTAAEVESLSEDSHGYRLSAEKGGHWNDLWHSDSVAERESSSLAEAYAVGRSR